MGVALSRVRLKPGQLNCGIQQHALLSGSYRCYHQNVTLKAPLPGPTTDESHTLHVPTTTGNDVTISRQAHLGSFPMALRASPTMDVYLP